jgi:hypothetical protein
MKKEVMNIEKALNRINWRFKNSQVKLNESKIIINQLDVDAIDFLTSWIEQQKKETKQENLLFAKVFTYAFKNELIFYNGSAKFAQKKLVDILRLPLQYHYDEVHSVLNMFDLYKYSKQIGLTQKHPALKSKEEEENDLQILKSKDPLMLKKILGNWTKESVYKSLNNTITEAINRFKNLD